MSQPMNRRSRLPALGEIDREAGEFWAENPFLMPGRGDNLSAFERNCVYMNLGGEQFLDVSFASGADIDADSRSVIAADIDLDGAIDLLVGSVGGGPLRLFANRCGENNGHVLIELVGVESNRSGIGSRVVIDCDGRTIHRDVFAANGFMGQGPSALHVGLGNATIIDRMTVYWPSGAVSEFAKVPVGGRIVVTEGEQTFASRALKPAAQVTR
ncbi:MAG: ASPIC/UnbV domain-containing protein [Pirellulaceae bacterium]